MGIQSPNNQKKKRGKIKMSQLKILQTVLDAVKEYNEKQPKYAAAMLEARQKYKNQHLREALNEIETTLRPNEAKIKDSFNEAIEKLNADVSRRYSELQERANDNRLNPQKITSDYAFLQLPTKLTGAELQVLHDRNWHDEIFVRALLEYQEKHSLPKIKVGNVFEDGLKKIDELKSQFQHYSSFSLDISSTMATQPSYIELLDRQLDEIEESTRNTYLAAISTKEDL